MKILVAILFIYSSTYMFRGLFDLKADPNLSNFKELLIAILIGTFCDFVPIMLLLIFHFRNFRDRKPQQAKDSQHYDGDDKQKVYAYVTTETEA